LGGLADENAGNPDTRFDGGGEAAFLHIFHPPLKIIPWNLLRRLGRCFGIEFDSV
jgi:hypothetical protein